MPALLAIGTTQATSADFTIADGSSATIFLTTSSGENVPTGSFVLLQIKSAAANYTTIGRLGGDTTATRITAPGTYRVQRNAGASVGVDQS